MCQGGEGAHRPWSRETFVSPQIPSGVGGVGSILDHCEAGPTAKFQFRHCDSGACPQAVWVLRVFLVLEALHRRSPHFPLGLRFVSCIWCRYLDSRFVVFFLFCLLLLSFALTQVVHYCPRIVCTRDEKTCNNDTNWVERNWGESLHALPENIFFSLDPWQKFVSGFHQRTWMQLLLRSDFLRESTPHRGVHTLRDRFLCIWASQMQ